MTAHKLRFVPRPAKGPDVKLSVALHKSEPALQSGSGGASGAGGGGGGGGGDGGEPTMARSTLTLNPRNVIPPAVEVGVGLLPVVKPEVPVVEARAELHISNFKLTDGGGVQLAVFHFTGYGYTATCTNTASMDGAEVETEDGAAGDTANLPDPVFFSVQPSDAVAGPAVASSIFSGAPILNADTTELLAASTVAHARSNVLGHVAQASAVMVTQQSFSLVTSRVAGTFGFSFDAELLLRSSGAAAQASAEWELKVTGPGGVTLMRWVPDGNPATGVQTGLSVSSEGCVQNGESGAGATVTSAGHQQALNAVTLMPDTIYRLHLTQTVTVSVTT